MLQHIDMIFAVAGFLSVFISCKMYCSATCARLALVIPPITAQVTIIFMAHDDQFMAGMKIS